MAADNAAGPNVDDNVGDVLWLLLAGLVVLGMLKVFVLTPPPPEAPPAPKPDFAAQEQAAEFVKRLEEMSAGLPAGGATIRPGTHAEGFTAGTARRVVFVLDGRKVMTDYWEAAVGMIRAHLLGSPSAETAEVVVLGGAEELPPPLTRQPATEPIGSVAVAAWCDQLEKVKPMAGELDPAAEVASRVAHVGAGTRVVVLVRDLAPGGKPKPIKLDVPTQFVLFGPPAGGDLGSWALRSAQASGGTVSFLP
jgi:hypothetical protein